MSTISFPPSLQLVRNLFRSVPSTPFRMTDSPLVRCPLTPYCLGNFILSTSTACGTRIPPSLSGPELPRSELPWNHLYGTFPGFSFSSSCTESHRSTPIHNWVGRTEGTRPSLRTYSSSLLVVTSTNLVSELSYRLTSETLPSLRLDNVSHCHLFDSTGSSVPSEPSFLTSVLPSIVGTIPWSIPRGSRDRGTNGRTFLPVG